MKGGGLSLGPWGNQEKIILLNVQALIIFVQTPNREVMGCWGETKLD